MASYDIGIIGGGPGGYVAALRASQLGLRTALFERDRVGGVCLNWGCIPSKALLKNAEVVNLVREAEAWGIRAENVSFDLGAAVDRSRSVVEKIVSGVEGLLKDANVDVVQGSAALGGPRVVTCGGVRHEVKNIVIASGTSSRNLPGLVPDGRVVLSSKDAVVLRKVPKHAVVIGAGPVGVEFGHLWASYGAKVTIVELLDANGAPVAPEAQSDTVLPQGDLDLALGALPGVRYRTRPVTSPSLDRQLRPIGHSIARNLTQTAIGMLSISPTWLSCPVA